METNYMNAASPAIKTKSCHEANSDPSFTPKRDWQLPALQSPVCHLCSPATNLTAKQPHKQPTQPHSHIVSTACTHLGKEALTAGAE